MTKGKIAVALSGGVDSAVAAALLQRDGHAVTAFFARGWSPKESRCDWAAEERDAMRVAAKLGIPFRSVDLGDVYEREVVGPLLDGYRHGRAVNPDVWCNKAIKFGALLAAARAEGFQTLATGHYARISSSGFSTPEKTHDGRHEFFPGNSSAPRRLYRGVDTAKDQSYFLWALGQDELRAAEFPLGNLTKPEVRALAKKFDLPVAEKPDSQGVCFVGEMDFKEFLRARLRPEAGGAVDAEGKFAGRHGGAVLCVPGERIALAEVRGDLRGAALYVADVDVPANRITVGPAPAAPAGPTEIVLENVSETSLGSFARAATCQLRYRSQPVAVISPPLEPEKTRDGRHEFFPAKCSASAVASGGRRGSRSSAATIAAPGFAPAPGQSAVFYAADGECLGGGEVSEFKIKN